jgi:predicted site-specific integrase-resolvase
MNGRAVQLEGVFDRYAQADLSAAYAILVPQRRARIPRYPDPEKEGRLMASVAIYARVSSARQKKDQTIASQTTALRAHAAKLHLELLEEWVFEDEGHSGATLVRPALERLRDLVAEVGVDVVLCYAPDRLARKFAYQALLMEEFARAGTRVEFIKGPRGTAPRTSCWSSSRACSPSMRRPSSWSATGAARPTGPAPGRSTSWPAPRSATATGARPRARGRLRDRGA